MKTPIDLVDSLPTLLLLLLLFLKLLELLERVLLKLTCAFYEPLKLYYSSSSRSCLLLNLYKPLIGTVDCVVKCLTVRHF